MDKTSKNTNPKRSLGIAAACLLMALTAHAGPPLKMQPHWQDVPGVRELEAGNYERAVQQFEERLAAGRRAPELRAPVLIDLCIGYAMLNRFDDALRACDAAVETGRYRTLAYNNRGVVHMVRGQYVAALEDFAAATRGVNSIRVARTNRTIAQNLLASIELQREHAMYARNMDIYDVSVAAVRDTWRRW